MLQAAIVDDEPLARSRLRRLIRMVAGSSVNVAAECVDVDELLHAARGTHFDVLFLDIEMPGGNGFTALRRWNGPRPLVVLVTAYDQHGIQAFEDRAVDYLLKPVSAERLKETISRLQERVAPMGGNGDDDGRKLPLQVGRRTRIVSEKEIQLIRANGNYLDIETLQGTFTVRRPMVEFLDDLDAGAFARVHRSAAVRSAAVKDVLAIGAGRYRITLDCGRTLVSGRLYRQAVRELIKTRRRSAAGQER